MPKKPKTKKKGFTLIELLVVIAIIGILASIVLVSLSGAKNKAKDARVVAAMGQIRAAAEMVYAADTSYANVAAYCTAAGTTDIGKLCADITTQASTPTFRATGTAYCGYVTLNVKKNNLTNYLCVDSTGVAKETQVVGGPGGTLNTYCNGTSYVCP